MSQYKLDITGNFNLSDYAQVSDYIDIVDEKDDFIVNFDDVSNENINIVCNILEEKNFYIITKEKKAQGTLSISAVRKK